MNAPDRAAIRLTQFSHGGGCGCKAPDAVPSVLAVFRNEGFAHIGECVAGPPRVRVR